MPGRSYDLLARKALADTPQEIRLDLRRYPVLARLLGLALILLCIWTAAEVYAKGTSGAFGGLFARWSDEFGSPPDRPPTDRAADAFQRAWNTSEARVDRALERERSGD